MQTSLSVSTPLEVLIHHALRNSDNYVRSQAEAVILQLREASPSRLFLHCAELLADSAKEEFVRNSAGVLLGRLSCELDAQGVHYWDTLGADDKAQVKNTLLNTLVCPVKLLMRCGAHSLSQIAAIELPRKEWLGLVDVLASTTVHEQAEYRQAAITTLGFICQQLKAKAVELPAGQQLLQPDTCETILGSILIGTSQQADMLDCSLTALRDAMCFLAPVLANPQYCHSVMSMLFDKVGSLPQPDDHLDLVRRVYEVLYEFAKHCYEHVLTYFKQLTALTHAHLLLRTELAVLALELWDTLGQEYLERTQDHVTRLATHGDPVAPTNYLEMLTKSSTLLPEMMKCLLILDDRDRDFPDLREVATKTLSTCVECCSKTVVDSVMEGVSAVIASDKWGERQSSALLFSTLCEYPDRAYIETAFENGFEHFYKLLSDPAALVRKNTLNGFVRFSEYFPVTFLRRPNLKDICQLFMTLVAADHEPDTRMLALVVLNNLTDGLKDWPEPVATDPDVLLTAVVQHFTGSLASRDGPDEKVLVTIMNIVMVCPKKDVITHLAAHLLDQYKSVYASQVQDKMLVLDEVLTLVHTCVLSLGKTIPSDQLFPSLVAVLDLHLQAYGVEQEAINLIGALALTYKRAFADKLEAKYWATVVQGLESVEQKSVFRTALSCVADISRAYETKYVDKVVHVFQRLLQYIQASIDRDLKLSILACFGDLALGLRKYSETFVDSIIDISNSCFEAVKKFQLVDSEKAYAEELKETLVEMYHCVVFAMNDQRNPNAKLAQHFPIVATFVVQTSDAVLRPTVDYLRNGLYLIFDSALFYSAMPAYKNQVNAIVDSPQVRRLVDTISQFRHREDVAELLVFLDSRAARN